MKTTTRGEQIGPAWPFGAAAVLVPPSTAVVATWPLPFLLHFQRPPPSLVNSSSSSSSTSRSSSHPSQRPNPSFSSSSFQITPFVLGILCAAAPASRKSNHPYLFWFSCLAAAAAAVDFDLGRGGGGGVGLVGVAAAAEPPVMEERQAVNPACPNAANPFHRCADYCPVPAPAAATAKPPPPPPSSRPAQNGTAAPQNGTAAAQNGIAEQNGSTHSDGELQAKPRRRDRAGGSGGLPFYVFREHLPSFAPHLFAATFRRKYENSIRFGFWCCSARGSRRRRQEGGPAMPQRAQPVPRLHRALRRQDGRGQPLVGGREVPHVPLLPPLAPLLLLLWRFLSFFARFVTCYWLVISYLGFVVICIICHNNCWMVAQMAAWDWGAARRWILIAQMLAIHSMNALSIVLPRWRRWVSRIRLLRSRPHARKVAYTSGLPLLIVYGFLASPILMLV